MKKHKILKPEPTITIKKGDACNVYEAYEWPKNGDVDTKLTFSISDAENWLFDVYNHLTKDELSKTRLYMNGYRLFFQSDFSGNANDLENALYNGEVEAIGYDACYGFEDSAMIYQAFYSIDDFEKSVPFIRDVPDV